MGGVSFARGHTHIGTGFVGPDVIGGVGINSDGDVPCNWGNRAGSIGRDEVDSVIESGQLVTGVTGPVEGGGKKARSHNLEVFGSNTDIESVVGNTVVVIRHSVGPGSNSGIVGKGSCGLRAVYSELTVGTSRNICVDGHGEAGSGQGINELEEPTARGGIVKSNGGDISIHILLCPVGCVDLNIKDI